MSPSKTKRWAWRSLFAIASLCALIVAGLYGVLNASLAQLDGYLQLPMLKHPVSVQRDALGVPTITAASRLDLARVTGFVHAQERFFQMDLLRRDAAGELSQLFGGAGLSHDKKRRFHGLRGIARVSASQLGAADRELLEAYTAGVNSGLKALTAKPFEYFALNQSPAPWRVEDTILVIHAMWLTLTDENADRDLNLTRLHEVVPAQIYDYLTQRGTDLDAALDGSEWPVLPIPDAHVYNARARAEALSLAAPASAAIGSDAHLEGLQGSNNWAVTAKRSAHGGAIVANDMHLMLRVPNLWFRARLQVTGKLDMTGVTLPGTPAIVAGSTGKIAWGFTNSYADTADLVRLELHPDDPRQYLTQSGYKQLSVRTEVIEIAGGEAVAHAIDKSIWGPVRDADGVRYAVQWMAREVHASNIALMRFEHLDNVAQALDGARAVGMPPQNLVVVDTAGNAGWAIAGALPALRSQIDRRRALAFDQASVTLGRIGAAAPSLVNPADGNLYSANSRLVDANSHPGLGDGSYALGARQAQIRDGLRAHAKVDEAVMLDIALDDRALFLERWRALLAASLTASVARRDPRFQKIRELLPSWSGRALPEDVAYRWVREFRTSVTDLVMQGLLAEVRARYPDFELLKMRQLEGVVWQILGARPQHLLSPQFADYDALLVGALKRCVQRVADEFPGPVQERTHGEYNRSPIAHPLTRAVPQLAKFLNMPDEAQPGDAFMPRVRRRWGGASQRFAVSPGKEQLGYFHMPAGQSGHPLSPFYRAGHSAWVHGVATPFLPGTKQHLLQFLP
jgi:penicillin G amidase